VPAAGIGVGLNQDTLKWRCAVRRFTAWRHALLWVGHRASRVAGALIAETW